MMTKRPGSTASIHDVARAAGVSIASVSRVLNSGSGSVSDKTRAQVMKAVESLGYSPNHMGRSLRARKSNTYAFMLSNIQNNLFSAVAWELERLISAQGAGMLLYTTNEDPEMQDNCIEDALSRQVAGIFFLCAVPSTKLALAVGRGGCIFINRRIAGLEDVPFVGIDDLAAAQDLMLAGLRRTAGQIAVVHGPLRSDTSARRLRGLRLAAEKAGRPIATEFVREAELSMESGYHVSMGLLSGQSFGAIFCGNDQIAYGVWRRCRELGISVPGDLHLYGFDDNPLNEWLAPWLSTVRVPYKAFAATAAQIMEIGDTPKSQDVMLPYELVIRV
jgi:LacI family transcriptional regulator